MKLAIHTQLDYFFAGPTDVLLQLEAAAIPEQTIERAYIDISPVHHFARVPAHDCIGDRLWLNVEGRLTVDYTSTVSINRICGDIAGLAAVPPHLLPGETVQYLFASRYCPSDQFGNFVDAQFGSLTGGARVQAIHDWIEQHFTYVAGSSTAATGAIDTFVMRQGVCRDFAHVMVTLTRACGIPARFASVYAPKVSPQDFHAVAEVFLDGTWYMVDTTGMASGEDVAKIAVGRDAADTSFLTSYGQAMLNRQSVEVTVLT